MGFFDWWKAQPPEPEPAPVPPPPPPPRPLRLDLEKAPSFHPLPINPADPVDAELSRQWHAFTRSQRTVHPTQSWQQFIVSLKRRITDAETATAKTAHELSDFKDDP